jgi:hypothetical protein
MLSDIFISPLEDLYVLAPVSSPARLTWRREGLLEADPAPFCLTPDQLFRH